MATCSWAAVIGFSTMTWAGDASASIARPKWEEGGVVMWTTSGRTDSSIARWSVNQAAIPYRSAAASAMLRDRSQTPARETFGSVRRQARC